LYWRVFGGFSAGSSLSSTAVVSLEIRSLTKRYRGLNVVDHVNFTLQAGMVTGYLGPNGSGKSTTVKMLTGLVEPTSGDILLEGIDIRRDFDAFKQRLGYVPEEAHVYPSLTAMEYLQLVGRLRGMPESLLNRRSGDLLTLFGLHLRRHSLLAAYSKGMRQRVLISAALLHDPDILIFDEPLSGLDVSSILLFKSLVAELAARGKIILYISHVLEIVERICGKVIIIYKGKIMAEEQVSQLRNVMNLPSLEAVFNQLVEQQDMEKIARDIADAIRVG
jgi:ABC-2 type transport system ATP-binding protein